MNEGIRPVIIKYEDGRMERGYVDLLSVVKEERDGSDVYSYTVAAYPPDESFAQILAAQFKGALDAEG